MKLNVFSVALTNVLLIFSEGAVIYHGKESSEFLSSALKDFNHFGSKDAIRVINAQTNQQLRDLHEKSFKRFPFRDRVKRNLAPTFVRVTDAAALPLFDAFTNSDSIENGRTINEATVIGNGRSTRLKIREKRCGKTNEKLAKFTNSLKASTQVGALYVNSRETNANPLGNDNNTKITAEETPWLMNAAGASTTTSVTSSSHNFAAMQHNFTKPLDFFKSTALTGVSSPKDGSIKNSSDETTERFTETVFVSSSTAASTAGSNTTTEGSVKTTAISEEKEKSSSDRAETSTMLDFTPKETPEIESVTLSETDAGSMEIVSTTALTTSTETIVTEASSVSEKDRISTETMTSTSLTSAGTDATESSTVSETDATESSTVSETDATESSTVSETDATESSTVSEIDATESSTVSETDATESSTVSETDATKSSTVSKTDATESSTVSETDGTESSAISETDAIESSTVSETLTTRMETVTATNLVSSSSSTDARDITKYSSNEPKTTSTKESTTYFSTTGTNEINTTDLRSTESTVVLSTGATEVHTENFSDRGSEKTILSSLKTSTVSTAVVTKTATSVEPSEITGSSVAHSTETESRSSTGQDGRSSTVDELIDNQGKKKGSLSPGKIAWIVIGILMVLAAFTGGIFLGNRYRTYRKREDTIALVVRNPNHRLYY